jgi:hypothetical protein
MMKQIMVILIVLASLAFFSTVFAQSAGGAETPTFTKHVEVFGIHVYATAASPNEKLLHSANVLAQYLDNDEDGVPDNQLVVDALLEKKAVLIMTKDSGKEWQAIHADLHYVFPDGVYHDCFANESIPNAIENGRFDGLWEEVLHLLTRHGWGNAYPSVFGPVPGTKVALAMDLARGGHFEAIPDRYPEGSWYGYYDESCGYGCQIDEYVYWALTSILGAQNIPGRAERVSDEWALATKEKVRERDPAIYALLTDPKYKFPTVLPDGNYRDTTFPIEEILFEVKVQEENYFPPKGRYPATVSFVTECQAPGGEAVKLSFSIAEDSEYAGKNLSTTAGTVLTLDSELFGIISDIRPELEDATSVEGINMKSIEGRPVWLTTEPMVGVSGSVFPKIVKIEPRDK